jgi:hypothetical protein
VSSSTKDEIHEFAEVLAGDVKARIAETLTIDPAKVDVLRVPIPTAEGVRFAVDWGTGHVGQFKVSRNAIVDYLLRADTAERAKERLLERLGFLVRYVREEWPMVTTEDVK